MLALSILINQIPITADVTDNLSSVVQTILGVRNDSVVDSYEISSTNAKLNYLEDQVSTIQSKLEKLERQSSGSLDGMSIAEIQKMCKEGAIRSVAHVGDTFSDGTYTYTIIGINQDKPSDADGNLLDRSKYGDVLTVMALGAPTNTPSGFAVNSDASKTPWSTTGIALDKSCHMRNWSESPVRLTTMTQYLEKLPTSTQKAIGYVQKVSGTYNGYNSGGANVSTGDKCFLLSGKEVFGLTFTGPTTEADATFQYQYFANIAEATSSLAMEGLPERRLWLRSAGVSTGQLSFFCIAAGSQSMGTPNSNYGIFPAFCIY